MKTIKKIENRKKIDVALKFIIPILLLFFVFIYFFNKSENNISDKSIFFSLIAIFFYFYYFIFVIYKEARQNVVDERTGCLLKAEFEKQIPKYENLLFFTILNLNELKIRYGFEKIDFLISKIVEKFDALNDEIIIGRITTNDFMILSNLNQKILQHESKKIFLEIKRNRIDDIDFNIEYSIIKANSDFSSLYLDAQNKLQNSIDTKTENLYATSIMQAIKDNKYIFKIQELKGNEKIYYLNYKLEYDYPSKINQSQIEDIIIKNNLEFLYYKNLFETLINTYDFKNRLIIKINPDFIRNMSFLFFMKNFIENNEIIKNKIIFEFYENTIYYNISRFDEIIKEFKKLGISFSLNRIGSSSSFEYLKKFDIEFGVFDIELTKSLNNEKIVSIYKQLLQLCKLINIKTVIRFVDNQKTKDKISEFNFDFFQGDMYYKEEILERKENK
ncbi:EAL domain-containing protein [Campylobacter canadensis]|uniref:EAL domain-containing protein n=1 Tax=Campylobacter canadensis TaxID=449520 RepID=UPI001CCC8629|nr:EAL domain-containing protein [Campylobacter canadensis]MBZ7995432.1 EAL domain-containing protein [Campylobacter canadensis]MBZ7996992.1 EAL domain-containing protein [Campylobacter canadensis]MBZ8000744.1 EAL domain-containing protein [Campylobacter canadensis]MBZ8002597.1 EAL domain-containing protein [Campylobacter canadensis]MBZ8002882.1 EAL domain-containing protein [Campylobacter canadensis]